MMGYPRGSGGEWEPPESDIKHSYSEPSDHSQPYTGQSGCEQVAMFVVQVFWVLGYIVIAILIVHFLMTGKIL